MTALMTSDILTAMLGVPVAALHSNPGATSLAARRASALSVWGLLAGREPGQQPGRGTGARLDVTADLPCTGAPHILKSDDYQRLADLWAERYPLTMIDPTPSGLTRVLSAAELAAPRPALTRRPRWPIPCSGSARTATANWRPAPSMG